MRSAHARFLLLTGFAAVLLGFPSGALASGTKTCAEAVLADWHDGRIDKSYRPACYRAALAALPEDLRVYSSASEDIERALHQRLAALAADRAERSERRVLSANGSVRRDASARSALGGAAVTEDTDFPMTVLVAAAAALALTGVAGVSAAVRRVRR
jgi:hypothetical protein